jgi:hypothetical protein
MLLTFATELDDHPARTDHLMSAKKLLIVTALVEAPVGLLLLTAPGVVVGLLLGAPIAEPVTPVLARIAGAALLALGVASWTAREEGASRAGRGLIAALLLYNAVAVAVLAGAGAGQGLAGILMWPTVALHAGLALWCSSLLSGGRR